MRGGLGAGLVVGFRGGQAGAGDGGPLGREPGQHEVASQGVRDQPGGRAWSVRRGVLDGGHQVGTFGVQPRQRVGAVGEAHLRRLDVERWQGQPRLLRIQQPRGRVGDLQVPVQQPPQRRLPRLRLILLLGSLAGVEPQQVVKPEPAGGARLQQVRAGQPIQQLRGPPERDGGQRGGGRCGHLGAWHQSQQPELRRSSGSRTA